MRIGLVLGSILFFMFYCFFIAGGKEFQTILKSVIILKILFLVFAFIPVVFILGGLIRVLQLMPLLVYGELCKGELESKQKTWLWWPETRWKWKRFYRLTYLYTGPDGSKRRMVKITISPGVYRNSEPVLYNPHARQAVLFREPGYVYAVPSGFPNLDKNGQFSVNSEPLIFVIVLSFIIVTILGIFSISCWLDKG